MSQRTHTRTVKMTGPTNERANPLTQSKMPPPDLTPGFYPDSQGVMRLWDGQRWTEVTRPMPQLATPPAGQPGYYPDAQGVMRWWTVVTGPRTPNRQPPHRRSRRRNHPRIGSSGTSVGSSPYSSEFWCLAPAAPSSVPAQTRTHRPADTGVGHRGYRQRSAGAGANQDQKAHPEEAGA
jgi:hypothetical protein